MADTANEETPQEQCEAVYNPGEWPYAKRCENVATVKTPEGSNYCVEHQDWDDE